ncbi:hypothetical protein COCHEDRAFT_1198041 [Bipolaris maydis C5]|uniref:Uncharacterized protein n=1 Tax=Cochliobolus heterostrophus (strain C5 / ATCC 48332 / race O) TaxID=701091 RepID=M2TY26_COCH5|nr:hypothetical protein COCHEDRAFT_1198041 [Bipolaris maydis C5]KAJ6203744.1 hypothetical protein PSV09DRAFT_1198041 [Bipolaris maydis]KAJ6267417.1 hypothetical protein PSV08DRAFT_208301 [Bipolaris maydis]KAJ6267631.1 hypothetical protein PSV08DRAFT_411883 [Bipolaris maydis]
MGPTTTGAREPSPQPLHAPRKCSSSRHLRMIQELGYSLRRGGQAIPRDEIATAAYLARPDTKGGICFILQQPADHHPYNLGADSVIESSPTLRALLIEIWPIVSCGAPSPTVLDRLPFVRSYEEPDLDVRHYIQERTFAMIEAKCPDVVVCMWRYKRGNGIAQEDRTGNVAAVEGLGVGQVFGRPTHVMASGHRIVRVNAFHPSFAMNYNPDLSCLRQLLILEVAQACGLYRGDWLNKRWMDELRERCKSITRERSRAQEMDVPQLAIEYKRNLESTAAFVEPQIETSHDHDPAIRYRYLVGKNITESLNNASLCIRAIHCMGESIDPDDIDKTSSEAIENSSRYTIGFVHRLVKVLLIGSEPDRNTSIGCIGLYDASVIDAGLRARRQNYDVTAAKIHKILGELCRRMNSSFTVGEVYPKRTFRFTLYEWSKILLSTAIDFEKLLSELAPLSKNGFQSDMDGITNFFDTLCLDRT